MFRNKKIEVLIRGILVLFHYGCIDSNAQVETQPRRKWSIALCDFLKMLGIVAVAGKDVLKYLTIAVANVYGCHTFGIGHDKCEIN